MCYAYFTRVSETVVAVLCSRFDKKGNEWVGNIITKFFGAPIEDLLPIFGEEFRDKGIVLCLCGINLHDNELDNLTNMGYNIRLGVSAPLELAHACADYRVNFLK